MSSPSSKTPPNSPPPYSEAPLTADYHDQSLFAVVPEATTSRAAQPADPYPATPFSPSPAYASSSGGSGHHLPPHHVVEAAPLLPQEGYDINLLEEPMRNAHYTPSQPEPKETYSLPVARETALVATPPREVSFWRGRRFIIVFVVMSMVIVGAVVFGALGGLGTFTGKRSTPVNPTGFPTPVVTITRGFPTVVTTTGSFLTVVTTTGPFPTVVTTTGPFPTVVTTTGPFPTVVTTTGPFPTVVTPAGASPTVVTTIGPFPTVVTTTGPFPTVVTTIGPFPTVVTTTGPFPTVVTTTGHFPTVVTARAFPSRRSDHKQ